MFINPLDVLDVAPEAAMDARVLGKAKRRLMVELELAGGELEIGGETFMRSDVLQALESLDDPAKVRGYVALRQIPELTHFLTTGDATELSRRRVASELSREAVQLVSPFFARRYGDALARALRKNDADEVSSIAGLPLLISDLDRPVLERPVDAVLQQFFSELESLCHDLKAERVDADEALVRARLLLSPEALNALPAAYVTSRSRIARALRNLSVTAFNVHAAVKPAYVLLSIAVRIDSTRDVREDLLNQMPVLREARDQHVLQERYAGEMKKVAGAMVTLHSLIESVERKEITPQIADQRARALVDIHVLNTLPPELGSVVTQVAYVLRALSVAVWNSYEDAAVSRVILDHALALDLPADASTKLREDRRTIDEIARARELHIREEAAEVRKLHEIVKSISSSLASRRADQVRWNIVSDKICELFGPDLVAWLARANLHAPGTVRTIVLELGSPLAGLLSFHRPGYEAVRRRLLPLTAESTALAHLVSPQSLRERAAQSTAMYLSTTGPAPWQQGWFWWVAGLAGLFLLSLCGS
jgi:hypothetical protein